MAQPDVQHHAEDCRLPISEKLEMMEYIARSALVRILLNHDLWPHFANTLALLAFWALEDKRRRELWGDIIDPHDALDDFDPRFITNGQLGAP